MKVRRKRLWLVGLVIAGLFLISHIPISESGSLADRLLEKLKKEYRPVEPLLPPDVEVKPGFEVGEGAPIGNAQMVQGKIYVVHRGQKVAYRMNKDYPLFTGDMLVSATRSTLRAEMNDKSVFALAPNSKLVIDESVYNPEKDTRSSLLSLLFGRARFIVAKIKGKPNYKIKTPTAVCGVRGSDFAIAVTPDMEKASSEPPHLFSSLDMVGEAHAAPEAVLLTIVVTGPGTTVSFSGLVGVAQVVGPVSVCAAATGAAAITPIIVGAAAAGAALSTIGPGLAALSMPPGF